MSDYFTEQQQGKIKEFAKIFSKSFSPEEKAARFEQFKKKRQRIIYNEDSYIENLFIRLHNEFQSSGVDHVSSEHYKYQAAPISLTEVEFSNLLTYSLIYAKRVLNQLEENDIEVIVHFKGINYSFNQDYLPVIPRYISVVKDIEGKEVVNFEEMLVILPTYFPEKENWSTQEVYYS